MIWKYELPVTDEFELDLPAHAIALAVQTQYDRPCLWVQFHNRDRENFQKRKFSIFGTGHKMPEGDALRYVGTFQLSGGAFVGHLYERV